MTSEATEQVVEVTQETVNEVNALVEYIQTNIPNIIGFGIKVLIALLTFCVGRLLIGWIRKIVKRSLARTVDKGVEQFVDSVLKFVLYGVLIFIIAAKLGIDTTSVAALVASGGVALGLALQGSLSNFAGGVLILLLKPFEVGDYIIEDTNGKEGVVKEIQIFYTVLSTIDNQSIVIPNGMLTNNSLTNVTAKDERRLDLKINISYEADLKKAKAVIENIVRSDASVMTDKEINVFVDDLAESSVVIGARAWVTKEEFWDTKWRLMENIKLTLDENHINIPYPQIVVHTTKNNSCGK